jgi:hypothetical protein
MFPHFLLEPEGAWTHQQRWPDARVVEDASVAES